MKKKITNELESKRDQAAKEFYAARDKHWVNEKKKMNLKRPLSWSAISSFLYDKEQWYSKYILGIKETPSAEMLLGKEIGERLATDTSYLPQVPRLPHFEYKLETTYEGIPLIGYIDSFCPVERKLLEFKSGKKAWDQERVDNHDQISMYLFLYNLMTGTPPEEIKCGLIWLPTMETGDFKISLIEPVKARLFLTRRRRVDIEHFGVKLIKTWKAMQKYCEEHE